MDTNELLEKGLIELLEIESLPDEEKAAIMDAATQIVLGRIFLKVDDLLAAADKEEFGKLLDLKDSEKVFEFLSAKIPNLPQIIEEEILKYKKEAFEVVEKEEEAENE